jgi:hypothetical protein
VQIGLGWLIVPPGRRPPRRHVRYMLLLRERGAGGLRSVAAVIAELDAAAVVLANHARSVSRLGLRVVDAHRRVASAPTGSVRSRAAPPPGRASDRANVRDGARRTHTMRRADTLAFRESRSAASGGSYASLSSL